MSDWKATERKIASLLGGRRVPITGRQRGDVPDISHDWLSIEVKERKALPAWLHDAMDQALAAQRSDQLPLVVLHQAGMRHDESYCVVRLKDFVDWFGGEKTDVA